MAEVNKLLVVDQAAAARENIINKTINSETQSSFAISNTSSKSEDTLVISANNTSSNTSTTTNSFTNSTATTTTIMPSSNSFLLSTLLSMKPNSGSSAGLSLKDHLTANNIHQKSKTLHNHNNSGGSSCSGEDIEDSDSGVRITYEQISTKPPRKRICYSSVHNSKLNSIIPNGHPSGSSPPKKSATITTTSDEENINSADKSTNTSPSSPSSTSASPPVLNSSEKELQQQQAQFPIVVRTDECRRRTSRIAIADGQPPGRVERYIVASRDIEPGEIILKEYPLIAGPVSRKSKTLDKSKYCLGCYQHVNGLYKCSKCGWPVCNAKCEKIADHAEFECEVFASNPVSPIVHSSEYEKIKVLRCLLLRDKYPERWNKLLELDSHDDLRQGNFVAVSSTINIFKFIKQECHLNQFDGETVNHVVGVSAVNAFPTDGLLTPSSSYAALKTSSGGVQQQLGHLSNNYYVPTNASLLFFNASLLTQDCVPNSYPIISKTAQNSYLLTVIASQRIKKGSIITHAFVDSTRGTFQRRSQLKENYYFSCDCRRCSDPAELSTHYSSLKCPKSNCPNGYLYPTNSTSLDLTGHWICNYSPRCDFRITNGQVNELLKHVQYDVSKTFVQHSLFQEYENLELILEKYKGKVLHPNHFLIMDIQYALITCINKLLVLVNEEEALKLATKQIEYCRQCLEISDLLHPGNNRLRGNLLFYLHEGMLIIFLAEFKRNINQESFLKLGKNKFEDIIKIMNESKSILINEPEGSTEYQKIKALTLDSANLQPLLKYFNIKL